MIELQSGFKGIVTMAVLAGGRNGFLMVVGMAVQTGRIQSEISELFAFDLAIGDELSLVAVLAVFLRMGSG